MIRLRPIPRLTPLELIGGGLLLWHIDRAVKHQRDCPTCAGRDFVAITLDVGHLWGNTPV
jgi:hypothetical protein